MLLNSISFGAQESVENARFEILMRWVQCIVDKATCKNVKIEVDIEFFTRV